MHTPPVASDHAPVPRRARFVPLAARLAAVVLLLAAGIAAVLWGWVQPRTARSFAALGADFLRDGSAAMHELSLEQSSLNSDILVDLLQSSVTERERALAGLRLQDLGGDAAAIRRAIADDDARRSAHERRRILDATAAGQRRAEQSIDARLHALTTAQAARTDEFVAELREAHLLLVGLTLAAGLLVLGIGLHQLVVAPTRRLRAATQRIAAGDLDVPAPTPAQHELGLLAHDFAAMTGQLRAARAEQQRLADGLADQVADKTAHLERALAELRASHAQLAQAERLAALGTLAGGIAHEFHNVIGGIRGCAAELAADERDADRRETLAVITRAADRGSGIVQQLLRFARRSVERSADLDPAAVLEDALRLCEPAARRQGVQVERTLTAGQRVRGDADGLHQVFVNLLVNALQAMPNGGTLRVRVEPDAGGVRITVADTGTGIDPRDLPHVFEPFFTTKAKGLDPGQGGSGLGGSGLGLSVSYGIVAAHRGRIEAASPAGQGATFTVWLPS
jgi:signal transduction histidine kinase